MELRETRAKRKCEASNGGEAGDCWMPRPVVVHLIVIAHAAKLPSAVPSQLSTGRVATEVDVNPGHLAP